MISLSWDKFAWTMCHSHPAACLPWPLPGVPFPAGEAEPSASRTLVSLLEQQTHHGETLPQTGVQLRPSKWRYFRCPFVSFLLSWRFYLNSRKPSQFLHWFRKIFPKLTNPTPFARLKWKKKSSPPVSRRCPQPPTQPDLRQRARVSVTRELVVLACASGISGRADLKIMFIGIPFPCVFSLQL